MVRVEVRFEGRVQGVGFRYTTLRIASRYPITGIVKNEDDGSVFLLAEGSRESLEAFVADIGEAMIDNIYQKHLHWSEATGRFSSFAIA